MREITLRAAPSFQANWRRFRRGLPAFVKGVLRRKAESWIPSRETTVYKHWRAARLDERTSLYQDQLQPGLLSVLTPVWNGSPVRYLRTLAELLISQNSSGACEWIILDNGCTTPSLLGCLRELADYHWIRVERSPLNLGITRGLRRCLETATGRYVLPVDADDYLYPDALRVITHWINRTNHPPLLYTDEDKISGSKFVQPYLKPDWDPVLLLNSAYIAHLGIVDRAKALELGAYSDENTEGSPDWDLFVRFLVAGYQAVHIPEILYGWRVHAHSTADDAATKPYIQSSQRAVLQRFLDARPDSSNFKIEHSPLLGGAAHWRFVRDYNQQKPMETVVVSTGRKNDGPCSLFPLADRLRLEDGLIHFVSDAIEVDGSDWVSEANALFELHPDTVMVGGRVRNRAGIITEAGQIFGVGGVCGSPNAGRSVLDPGYFTQIWKQRSVSAVSVQFAVVRAGFLKSLLQYLPSNASLPFLGAWAGAYALRTGQRVIYSPYLSGVSDFDWHTLLDPAELQLFECSNRDIIPDLRYYSKSLSLSTPFALSENPRAGIPGFNPSKLCYKP
jgi:glycosyltransferase involved in cell wall biosynthesis